LRKFAEKVLPPEFDRNRKQGFGIPLGYWLRGGAWRTMFENVLFDSSSMFSRSSVESLFRGVAAARPVNEQLFGLTLFELWRKEYGVSV
jgi:asparagine synthase (glutamine-hydrolysing)